MNKLITAVSRIPNYLRTFGPVPGIRLFQQVEFGSSQSMDVRAHHVPGLKAPVWLRGLRSDHSVFWQCLTMDQYSLDPFPHSKVLLEKYRRVTAAGGNSVIVDAGGNIGLATVRFANIFPQATIYTIEPDSRNFEVMTKNTAPYKNVTPVCAALWTGADYVAIENPDSGASSFRVRSASKGEPGAIPAVSMESLLEKTPDPELLIVKLDIEGAQQWLFEAGTEWVPKADLIMLELDDWQYPWRGTSRSFFRCLSQYPFEYLIRGELIFCFNHTRLAPNSAKA